MGKRSSRSQRATSAQEDTVENNQSKIKPKRVPKLDFQAINDEQRHLLKTIHENSVTFVKGPPGCGKTFIAVGYALQHLFKGDFSGILFSRPAVEADERLGYLPGDVHEKINPYMIPIYDSLYKLVGPTRANELLQSRSKRTEIRVLPIAYMRGVTFDHSFVVIDEAQNITVKQMRMILTRLGDSSKIVICGDAKQSDLNGNGCNGLSKSFELLRDIDDIAFVEMTHASIVRHAVLGEV